MTTVFISYAHESDEFREQVKVLADWLQARDCKVLSDHQFPHRPPEEGWQTWMEGCLRDADIVLVICTPKLKARHEKTAPVDSGFGATFEGAIITQYIYGAAMRNRRFFPVLPDGGSEGDIPIKLLAWWHGRYFPSGNVKILETVLNKPDPTDAPTSKSPVQTPPHLQHVLRCLNAQGAADFLAAYREALGGNAPTRELVERIEALSESDESALMAELRTVQRAVNKLPLPISIVNQDAAIALYILIACRLAARFPSRSESVHLLRCHSADHVIYALIATALFGGTLAFEASSHSLPKVSHVYVVEPPAGSRDVVLALGQQAFLMMNACDPKAPEIALDMPSVRSIAEFQEGVAFLREVQERAFVFVVENAADVATIERFSSQYRVPVIVPLQENASTPIDATLGVSIEALRANIQTFWRQFASSIHQAERTMPAHPPSASPPSVHVSVGPNSNVAVSTGPHSPAHAEQHNGIKLEELQAVLKQLSDLLSPVKDNCDAPTQSAIAVVEQQASASSPQFEKLRTALTTIKNGVTGAAALGGGVQNIAALIKSAFDLLP